MRLTRVLIAALAVITLGLAFTYLTTRAMPGGAAVTQGNTFLPNITQTQHLVPSATPTRTLAPVANLYTYAFSIDRSAAPALYYTDLSYVVHLGSASNTSVLIDNTPVASTYDPASGNLVFTTSKGGGVTVRFAATSAPSAVSAQKASLRDNKAWAWSHGMDDNVGLLAQVNLIKARGWRGSLMLIGEKIDDTRQEQSWIFDKPILVTLRNQGWSLGDHSWDHNCDESAPPAVLRKTIIDGYDRLREIVAATDDPRYQVLAFAAPCVISPYTPVFADLVAGGTTTLRFNETQGSPLMNVDGADYTSGDLTATAMDASKTEIGRDSDVEGAPEKVNAVLDWMAANKAADRHFWLNTLSHGDREADLGQILDHAYTTYGPGGSDEIWVAPSDEIYSYLLTRDKVVVTPGSLIAPAL